MAPRGVPPIVSDITLGMPKKKDTGKEDKENRYEE